MVIGDFYRVIDSDDLSPAEAIRVDREIVAMQRRMRRIKEIVAEATNDA